MLPGYNFEDAQARRKERLQIEQQAGTKICAECRGRRSRTRRHQERARNRGRMLQPEREVARANIIERRAGRRCARSHPPPQPSPSLQPPTQLAVVAVVPKRVRAPRFNEPRPRHAANERLACTSAISDKRGARLRGEQLEAQKHMRQIESSKQTQRPICNINLESSAIRFRSFISHKNFRQKRLAAVVFLFLNLVNFAPIQSVVVIL